MDVNSFVVVPARDEAEHVEGCLRALAEQTVGRDAFAVVLIADACQDGTEAVARRAAAETGLRLIVLTGPGLGPGTARRIGMDHAADRLLATGRPDGLIATTDADSAPAPDWLERQLAHLAAGAQVIAGMIELTTLDQARLPAGVRRRRSDNAARRLTAVRTTDPDAEHHHFAGASIGITATTYRRVGGIEPLTALEDAAFARRLHAAGVPVLRAADVRVRTSARQHGRASQGLSVDLAVSDWLEHNRFQAGAFDIDTLAAHKRDQRITVIVSTKACAATITGVVTETALPLRRAGLVDELVVIDAGSDDGTASLAAAAGAEVLQQDELVAQLGPAQGKGDAMWRALQATTGDLVCFLDGDTADPTPLHLIGLLGPLLTRPEIHLVKGTFEWPMRDHGRQLPHEGGRVTELMVRPLVNLHEPLLAGFSQPLAGEFAGRRELLETIPFPVGHGVAIAILIDALRRNGLRALAETDLGPRQNRHRPLRALGEMAYAVLAAVERRCRADATAMPGGYLRPWDDGAIAFVATDERPPLAAAPDQRNTSSGGISIGRFGPV